MTTPIEQNLFYQRQQGAAQFLPSMPQMSPPNIFTATGNTITGMASAFAPMPRPSHCYSPWMGCGNIFNNPIFNADKAEREYMLSVMMRPIPTSNSGPVQPATTDSAGNKLEYTNKHECFDKLDTETLGKLKDIEKQIKDTEAKLKEAKENNDKEAQKTHAAKLRSLRSQFKELEKELSVNGQTPSQILKNKDYTLYTNLSEEELAQIKEYNVNIKEKKEEAEELKKQITEKKNEAARLISEAQKQGIKPDEAVSKEMQEEIKALEKAYNEKLKEISDIVKELDTCVKGAIKNTDSIDFLTHSELSRIGDRKKEKAEGNKKVGNKIAEALFDKDGKFIGTKEKLKEAIDGISSKYTDNDINAIVDFISEQAQNCTKEEFIAKMQTVEFTNAASQTIDTDKGGQASLFMKIADSLFGGEGKYAAAITNGTAKQNIKALEEQGEKWDKETAETPSSSSKKLADGSSETPAEKKPTKAQATKVDNLIKTHTKDGKVDYKAVINDIQTMKNTGTSDKIQMLKYLNEQNPIDDLHKAMYDVFFHDAGGKGKVSPWAMGANIAVIDDKILGKADKQTIILMMGKQKDGWLSTAWTKDMEYVAARSVWNNLLKTNKEKYEFLDTAEGKVLYDDAVNKMKNTSNGTDPTKNIDPIILLKVFTHSRNIKNLFKDNTDHAFYVAQKINNLAAENKINKRLCYDVDYDSYNNVWWKVPEKDNGDNIVIDETGKTRLNGRSWTTGGYDKDDVDEAFRAGGGSFDRGQLKEACQDILNQLGAI